MEPIVKQRLIEAIISDDRAHTLDLFCRDMFDLGLVELLDFRERYGEFATLMLLHGRVKRIAERDVMREAVEEIYNDKDFMKHIPDDLHRMVHDALHKGQYSA